MVGKSEACEYVFKKVAEVAKPKEANCVQENPSNEQWQGWEIELEVT